MGIHALTNDMINAITVLPIQPETAETITPNWTQPIVRNNKYAVCVLFK